MFNSFSNSGSSLESCCTDAFCRHSNIVSALGDGNWLVYSSTDSVGILGREKISSTVDIIRSCFYVSCDFFTCSGWQILARWWSTLSCAFLFLVYWLAKPYWIGPGILPLASINDCSQVQERENELFWSFGLTKILCWSCLADLTWLPKRKNKL